MHQSERTLQWPARTDRAADRHKRLLYLVEHSTGNLHALRVSPWLLNGFQTNVVTSVGHTTVVNFVLQPVNPPGVSCLIQPTPNPIPFQGPIPGIACMPNWVWYTLGAAVFGIIVVAVLAWSPFGGALVSGAGRGLRSLTNRGGNGRGRHRGYPLPPKFPGKYR